MPWVKGQSGNPRGRVKIPEDVRQAAREHTVKAVETLAACLTAPKAPWVAKITAAEKLLDRGWGKPDSNVSVTGTVTLASLLANLPALAAEQDETQTLN